MSMLFQFASAVGTGVTYQLDASNTITSHAPEGQASDAQYRFNTDGTLVSRVDLSVGGTQDTTETAWSDNLQEDGTNKYVRLVYASGTDRRTDLIGDGFVVLSTQRIYTFQNSTTTGPYSDSATYTVDISLDGSTVWDTQSLTVTLENVGP